MFSRSVAILLILAALPSTAAVDTSSGSFVHSWTDFEGGGMDLKISLVRTYHSRSNHIGWFGFGWCTDLETKLIRSEDLVEINHCGDGKITTFNREGSQFKSKNPADGVVKKVGINYERSFSDGTKEIYNSEGYLLEVRKGNLFIKITYNDKGLPIEISDSGERLVKVESTQQNTVSRIQFFLNKKNKDIKAVDIGQYSYEDKNLVEAKNSWGNVYIYQYDKKHNMTLAKWPNGKLVQIAYNNSDWVQSLSGTDLCKEAYSYKIDNSRKPPRYAVTLTKECPDGTKVERSYAYTYALDNSRVIAADLIESTVKREYIFNGDDVIRVTEHRHNGKLVTEVKRNSMGQIVEVSNPFEIKSYTYKQGSSRHLVVDTEIKQIVMGKVASSSAYSFGYNDRDLLIFAVKPNNVKVEFKWSDDDVLTHVKRDGIEVELVYGKEDEVIGVKYKGKVLPINIYEVSANQKEISAVESYLDFHRMQRLTIPSY